MSKILIVEDDIDTNEQLKKYLSVDFDVVDSASDGQTAYDLLQTYKFDAVVLDWELPKLAGADLVKKLRCGGDNTPILMLTGRSSLSDKETGFVNGADDYVTKPFVLKEVAMRLRALIRRASGQVSNVLTIGSLKLEPDYFRVSCNNEEIRVVPKEFALLEFLMRHPDEVFSSDQLLDRLWPSDSEVSANTIRSYVYTLRKRLAGKCTSPTLDTIAGVGYKLRT